MITGQHEDHVSDNECKWAYMVCHTMECHGMWFAPAVFNYLVAIKDEADEWISTSIVC